RAVSRPRVLGRSRGAHADSGRRVVHHGAPTRWLPHRPAHTGGRVRAGVVDPWGDLALYVLAVFAGLISILLGRLRFGWRSRSMTTSAMSSPVSFQLSSVFSCGP